MVLFFSSSLARKALKTRRPESHKGENGRVLVVGGSSRYAGAPALAGLASLHSGADLAYVVAPSVVSSTIAGFSPDLIVQRFEGDFLNEGGVAAFSELAPGADALVLGNGLGKNPKALSCAQKILSLWSKPAVVDGDALGFVSNLKNKGVIYTPHMGEFARMGFSLSGSSIEAIGRVARNAARSLGGVVLLKGPVDIISDGERVAFNKTGNASMTVGGTGDVLAGLAGGFLSQGHSAFNAACLAAFVNGSAGDLAFKEVGYSLLASNLLRFIPRVLKRIR